MVPVPHFGKAEIEHSYFIFTVNMSVVHFHKIKCGLSGLPYVIFTLFPFDN